jgi:50S ribosome-binding GTPase
MATPKELLSNVVRDFDILYHAYEKAGLLGEHAGTEAAKKLLGSGEDVYRFKREFLLAEALIRNRVGRLAHGGNGLKHLAVFGGNNVGKSTVVNILAAEKVTSTSPEGGHTRHAVAISTASVQGGTRGLFGENPFAFRPFSPVHVHALDRDRLDQYGKCSFSSDTLPQDVVLWDMPDCDATDSRKYMSAVIEAVTSADAIVYVTSVGKFAVEHVVEWIFILHDAGIHVLQCLN